MNNKIIIISSIVVIISFGAYLKYSDPVIDTPIVTPTSPIQKMPEIEQESIPAKKSSNSNTPKTVPIINSNILADDTGATLYGISEVVVANNQFAIDIYNELKKEPTNIFFSPYSISTAMAMVYEGSKDNTAKEIQKTVYFPTNDQVRRSSFASIHNKLNNKDSQYKLSIANALWVQEDFKLLNTYTETISKYYSGNATNLDFKHNAPSAIKTINSWVENQTNNKIKNLFKKGSLDESTRLVLTNAIYFKGQWAKEFNKLNTKDADFKTNSGATVSVPMMKQSDTGTSFMYTETDDLQVINLPYKGEDLSMLILLPKENSNIATLENSLSVQKITELRNNLTQQNIVLLLPKFNFESDYTLNKTLKKLGVMSAFIDPEKPNGADFTGIYNKKVLYISMIVHKAFIDVNEEGTEAAAATGVGISGITSVPPPPKIFRANSPFIFIIQDSTTGNILFLGKIIDPSK